MAIHEWHGKQVSGGGGLRYHARSTLLETAMTLAIFDLDNTLLAGDSDHAWGEYLIEQGLVDGAGTRPRMTVFTVIIAVVSWTLSRTASLYSPC
jgi:hypothetical protein